MRRTSADDLPTLLSVTGNAATLVELFRRFIRSPHFAPWFRVRREQSVRVLQMEACRRCGIPASLSHTLASTREVQLLDMFVQVRVQIQRVRGQRKANSHLQPKLQRRLERIMSLLPNDVQKILRENNPGILGRDSNGEKEKKNKRVLL